MPPMDVIIGKTVALVLAGLLIGVIFADLFANKKSIIITMWKQITARISQNRQR
jgi:hypothetical protein